MTTIRQTVDVAVPVAAAYAQLRRFEEYPRFMHGIASVSQLDDTHLHWSAVEQERSIEWDAEITEQLPGRRLAWRNTNGPVQGGMLELEAAGPRLARVTLTIDCRPGPDVDLAGTEPMQQRLEQDLASFKNMVEQAAIAQTAATPAGLTGDAQADRSTQSSNALSQSSDDTDEQGQFSVAEEISFDQQTDQARRVGQMPAAEDSGSVAGIDPADGVAKAIRRDDRQQAAEKIDQAFERAVPPSP